MTKAQRKQEQFERSMEPLELVEVANFDEERDYREMSETEKIYSQGLVKCVSRLSRLSR